MAKKKQEEAPAGSPAWMATFSDLMNLLLCFFVLLFSMSSTDAAKFEMVVNSLQSAFSIMPSGGSTLSDNGMMIGGGIAQLPGMSNYFGDTLSKGEGKSDAESKQKKDKSGEEDAEGQTPESQETADINESIKQAIAEAVMEAQKQGAISEEKVAEIAAKAEAAAEAEAAAQKAAEGEAAEAAEGEQTGQSEISEEEAVAAVEKKELDQSEQMAQNIEEMTKYYGIQDLVEIDFNGQYVRVTLNGALLFESGSADLSEEAKPLVEKMGRIIDIYDNNIVEVEGHTDNVPIHSSRFESNDVLSMYRALSVANYLRDHSKVPTANIVSSGRGAYVPVADNSTPEGRARNRRVEIKIFNEINSEEAVEE